MTSLWPWLAVAGAGALHGLNPATGWGFAAAWSATSRDRAKAWRALLPIASGHFASIALVAAAVALRLPMYRSGLLAAAGALLLVLAATHLVQRQRATAPRGALGHIGLALWSFVMSTAHGAGLMLVPALVPLCLADSPARQLTASGSLAMALGAIAVHTASMLAVTALAAAGVGGIAQAGARLKRCRQAPAAP